MLYKLRYRTAVAVREDLIEVKTEPEKTQAERAMKVGMAFCSAQPNRRYISTELAIVADESIVPAGTKETARVGA